MLPLVQEDFEAQWPTMRVNIRGQVVEVEVEKRRRVSLERARRDF